MGEKGRRTKGNERQGEDNCKINVGYVNTMPLELYNFEK